MSFYKNIQILAFIPFVITILFSLISMLNIFKQNNQLNSTDEYINVYNNKSDINLSKHSIDTVNYQYNIATDFYEQGWGQSFHFANRHKGETHYQSIIRHEQTLSDKLGLKQGMNVLDLGCGVGGPLRNIVRYSGSNITGVTLNEQQIKRAKQLTKDFSDSLKNLITQKIGDFNNLQFIKNNSIDAIYYIESAVHTYNRTIVFNEAYRVLKPGGHIVSYEWLLTNKFNKNNETHNINKRKIEYGNGLPELITIDELLKYMNNSGLQIIEHYDMDTFAQDLYSSDNIPWQNSLLARFTFDGILHTSVGRMFTNTLCWITEKIRISHKGTYNTAIMLSEGADGLAYGGQQGIFTPMQYVKAQKVSEI